MRKLFFLLVLTAVTVLGSQAVTVQNTAGQLSHVIQDTQITQLTVKGTMDARDFLFISEELTELTSINLSQATIVPVNNAGALYGTIDSYKANEIPRTAFFGKKLTSVTLPSNIEVIGYAAFAGCYQLHSVEFPASLVAIEDYAFAGSALTSVTLPATVQLMGKGVFSRCESLTTATIEAQYVGDFAFLGDYRLSQVTIGAGVKTISRGMFNGCTALTTLNIDPACRMARIDDEAFINSGLQNIDINTLGIGTIGEWALAQTQLTGVNMSNGMSQLGEGALAHNPLLESVVLPGMGHENGPKRAPHRPHTLAEISDYAFAGDGQLNPDLLREGVTTIGNYALYNVSADVDTMWLPSTVAYLGDMAMAGMIGMKNLKTDAVDVPALGNDVWAGVDQPSVSLFAPTEESTELYKVANQWMNFFFPADDDFILGDINGDGRVNIADVTALIALVLSGNFDGVDTRAADVNQDGNINIADVTMLIGMVLSGNTSKSLKAIHAQMMDRFVGTSDVLALPELAMKAGETRTIDVQLKNTEHNYSALQFELVLPEGLSLVDVKGIDRGAAHDFYMRSSDVEENVYSIMGAAMDMTVFAGSQGNVLRLTVAASDSFSSDDAELTLTNVVLVTAASEPFYASDAMTRIMDVSGIENVLAGKEISSVRYINVAGMESEVPFDGMNIVVTTYTDGSSTTVKVIK